MPDAPVEPGPPILDTELVAPPPSWGAPPGFAPPPEAPRFSVGGALSRTMRAWWAHAWAFTAISLVVYAPLTIGYALVFSRILQAAGRGRPPPDPAAFAKAFAWMGLGLLLTMALNVLQFGAVTYGTVQHLNGARASPGRMLSVALRRSMPVLGTSTVVGVVALAGFALLFVPGAMFVVASCVAVPAAVVERPGVVGALQRSFDLTRGLRWPLFATGGVVLVVLWLLSLGIQLVVTVAALAIPAAQRFPATLIGSQLGNALFSAIPLVAFAVCYHDLRLAKEGVDTAELAKVFE